MPDLPDNDQLADKPLPGEKPEAEGTLPPEDKPASIPIPEGTLSPAESSTSPRSEEDSVLPIVTEEIPSKSEEPVSPEEKPPFVFDPPVGTPSEPLPVKVETSKPDEGPPFMSPVDQTGVKEPQIRKEAEVDSNLPEEGVKVPEVETPTPPPVIKTETVEPSYSKTTETSPELKEKIETFEEPLKETSETPAPIETPPPAITPEPGLEEPSASEVRPEGKTTPAKAEGYHVEKPSILKPIKKILPLILIALAIFGLLFVVFRFVLPGTTKSSEVTLTYWGLWESESVINGVLRDWEKEYPKIKVTYTRQSPKEYRERLQSALARGEGPDVFRFHNSWVPMLKNELESVPASVMDAATFEQTFYPVAATSLRSGVNFLGIPLEVDTLALFYNQDIFTAAGASPPKTWDDLQDLASTLTLRDDSGRIQRAGIALGTTNNVWHWPDILGLMMLQNGADLANPTGPLAEDALTFYTLFSKVNRIWDSSLPSSIMAFATGKTAMFFGYSWDVFELKAINPDINFKIISAPQPPGISPDKQVAWSSFWVEGVAKKSQNKTAAWEFIKYLSSKEVMQKLYQAQSQTRLFGEPYSRVDMAGLIQTDSMVEPFIKQAPKAKSWYLCSRTFDNGINDRMIKYFENAVNAVNAGQTSEEVLPTVAEGVSQILSQYGLASSALR